MTGIFHLLFRVRPLRRPAPCLPAVLYAILAAACAAAQPVTIIHLNDLHARLLPDANGMGGFAHVASAIAAERAAAANALVLHAGDMVQGTPVSTLDRKSVV